jgi:hypothetical protein
MVANSSEKLVKAHQMISNIRTILSSQTDVTKTINMALLLNLFVYRITKLCKVITQYPLGKAMCFDKVVPKFNEFKDEML